MNHHDIPSPSDADVEVHDMGEPVLTITGAGTGSGSGGVIAKWELPDGLGLHRDNGPAFMAQHPAGMRDIQWRRHSALHRVGGPANIVTVAHEGEFTAYWSKEGRTVCTEGPTRVSATGSIRWFWPGVTVSAFRPLD